MQLDNAVSKSVAAAMPPRLREMRLECRRCGCHHRSPWGFEPPLTCGNCGSASLHPIAEKPGRRRAPVYRPGTA